MDILFGWLTKPRYMISALDGFIFIIEFVIAWVLLIGLLKLYIIIIDKSRERRWKNENK